MKAMAPAAIAPIISRKVVKSGIIRATHVTSTMIIDLITTDFIFFIVLVPVLKKARYSTISKAANIWIGYDTKAFMHTQNKINVTIPLIGCRSSVNIGFVSPRYT